MDDLDKLKELLFGAEKQALESITRRVEHREVRTADVADILPEAIHRSHKKSAELVESLRPPVGECMQQEFHHDPQTYSDALYPVIGPAIRKSIMHALRNFSQQINEAVEQSLTFRGLRWRIQASRAGVPLGEFLLQKNLLYRVEQAYLISRENGLLVGHAHHEAAKIKDSDAVSAMFTAIQDFVQESFSPDRTGRLESADMGEFTLWAVHGPHALLVCVIRGVPPRALRSELSAILERIHFRYGDSIRSYSGDTSTVPDVASELDKCLQFEARQQDDQVKRGMPTPLLVLLLLAGAALVYFVATRWLQSQELARLMTELEQTAGVYVADGYRDDGKIVLSGMRDPLAPTIAEIAAAAGVPSDAVEARLRPFQSLEPEIVIQRVRKLFGESDKIEIELVGSRAIVSGPSTIELQKRVRDSLPLIAGVDAIEYRLPAVDRVARIRELLGPPSTIAVTAVPDGVALMGSAPLSWIESAVTRTANAELGFYVDLNALVAADPGTLQDRLAEFSGVAFRFSSGTTFAEGAESLLNDYAVRLRSLIDETGNAGSDIRITLTGSTDSSGDPAVNATLAKQRAAAAAGILTTVGIDPVSIVYAENISDDDDESHADPDRRRVTIELELMDSATTR